MKIKKFEKWAFVLLFIFSLNLFPLVMVRADEYTLGFEEGKDIIWERTVVNSTLINKLIDEGRISNSYSEKVVGTQVKYYIEDIDYDNNGSVYFWKIDYHLYLGTNLENTPGTEKGSGYYKNVAKDPADAAGDWATSESIYTYRFIPLEVPAYLTALVAAIGKPNITCSGSNLIYNNTVIGENDTIILNYNTNGILNNRSIYYNGSLAYNYELVYYSDFIIDQTIFIFILIILTIFVSVGMIYMWFNNKENRKEAKKFRSQKKVNLVPREKITSKPVDATPSPKISQVCSLCGSELDDDGLFCPNCGNKFERD